MWKFRIPCRRRLGRHSIVLALALVGVALSATRANAYQARVRWLPSTDPAVIGYRVYVRQAFRTYPAPVDVGKPAIQSDGTMLAVVGGLVSERTYYLAVSAYSRTLEGWLSHEIALGPTDPCIIDRCYTRTFCDFTLQDDGVSCGDGPCDVCRFARCTALPPVDIAATARVEEKPTGVRARLRGRFVPNGSVDPAITGVLLRFADRSGTMLVETTIPASVLKANANHRRFRLIARDAVYGVRRFNLAVGTNRARVSMLLEGYQFQPLAENPDLTWAMRFGSDQCSVDPEITCHGSRCR